MGSETEVTIATARFIGVHSWKVVSIALPRGGSGLSFTPDEDSESSIIPDIVAQAQQSNSYLFIESKPSFSTEDVEKLMKVKSGLYSRSIYSILNCRSPSVSTAVAFSGPIPQLDFASLGMDYVFHLDGHGKIVILHGSLN